jgi:hypothetical protein
MEEDELLGVKNKGYERHSSWIQNACSMCIKLQNVNITHFITECAAFCCNMFHADFYTCSSVPFPLFKHFTDFTGINTSWEVNTKYHLMSFIHS